MPPDAHVLAQENDHPVVLNDPCVVGAVPQPQEEKRVLASTIHGSKGLEWRNVVLSEADGRHAGHGFIVPDNPDHMEEVRLRYVAVTRATEHLLALLHTNCYPAYRLAFDGDVMSRIKALEDVLGEIPAQKVDEMTATHALRHPWFKHYIDDFAEHHLSPAAWDNLEAAGLKLPEKAQERLPVRRLSLQGWTS